MIAGSSSGVFRWYPGHGLSCEGDGSSCEDASPSCKGDGSLGEGDSPSCGGKDTVCGLGEDSLCEGTAHSTRRVAGVRDGNVGAETLGVDWEVLLCRLGTELSERGSRILQIAYVSLVFGPQECVVMTYKRFRASQRRDTFPLSRPASMLRSLTQLSSQLRSPSIPKGPRKICFDIS